MQMFISVAAAVLAAGAAVWSAWFAHRGTSHREYRAWEREVLLTAISELIQLSVRRRAVLATIADDFELFNRFVDPFDVEATGGPHPSRSISELETLAARAGLIAPELGELAGAVVDITRGETVGRQHDRRPQPGLPPGRSGCGYGAGF